ncbi:MAG: choline transporter, partial [Oceanospirillales bacterium]|nr:choline transporter [Oceanospirillales bacterium]
TLFVALWMSIFGNNAISLILDSGLTELGEQVTNNVSVALFVFLEQLPFSTLTQSIAVCLIVIFFVTSADSGSLVINILSCNGSESPPNWMRIFWTATIGVVAFVLLYAGGLSALQTMTIVSALPVSIILLFAVYGLFRVLIVDYHKQEAFAFTAYLPQGDAPNWRSRLQNMASFPDEDTARSYLDNTVVDALMMVVDEVESFADNHDLKASVERGNEFARIIITNGSDYDFCYSIHLTERPIPVSGQQKRKTTYYRAEVHLAEGGKDYSIMGWSQDSVICDVLNQYQKHMHFLHNISEVSGGSTQSSQTQKQRNHHTPGMSVEQVSEDIKSNVLGRDKIVVNT